MNRHATRSAKDEREAFENEGKEEKARRKREAQSWNKRQLLWVGAESALEERPV